MLPVLQKDTVGSKKLSLLIPKGLHTSLKKFALENDSTVTNIVIELIAKLVNHKSPKLTEKDKTCDVIL